MPGKIRSTCAVWMIAVFGALLLFGSMSCNEEVAGNLADCTLADNGDGTVTITCQDGMSYTVFDDVDCTIVNRDDGTQDVICGGSDSGGGQSGSLCTVVSNGDGTSTIRCNDGTEVIINGEPEEDGCTIVDNDDGTMTITCDDGTEVMVSDEPTEDTDTDTSCTIVENDDGTMTITCDDGTEVTVAGNPDDYACTITQGEGYVTINCGDQGTYTFYDDEAIVGDIVGIATLFGLDDHTGIVVTVVGTEHNTTTDAAGAFAITGVPLGIYQLSFEYTDYTSQAVTNVAALPGNFQLDPVTLRVGRLIRAGINRMPLALSPDEDGILILEHFSTSLGNRYDLPSTSIGIGSEYHESEYYAVESYRSERYYEMGSFGSYSIGKTDGSLLGDLVLYRRSTDSVEELAVRVDGSSVMFTPDGDVAFINDLTKSSTDHLTIYDTVTNTSEVLAEEVSSFWVSPDSLGNAVIYVTLNDDRTYDVVLYNRATELSETLFEAVSSDDTNVHFNADGTFALIQADLETEDFNAPLHLVDLSSAEMVLVDEAVDLAGVRFSVAGDMFAYVAYEDGLTSNALHRYDAALVMDSAWVEDAPPLYVHDDVSTGFTYGTEAIVFYLPRVSDFGTTADLYVIPDTLTAPATPVLIEEDTESPGKFGLDGWFSPDRSSFMFLASYDSETTRTGQLNVYDLPTGPATPLSENVSLDSATIGERALVYIENVALPTEELVVWDTGRLTDHKANLGDTEGFAVLFAPDGVSFVFEESGLEEEASDLNFWDIGGWAESFVTDIPLGGYLAPVFTGDGGWVLTFTTENRLDFDLDGWEGATGGSLPLDDSLTQGVLVGEHFIVYTVLETEWPGLIRSGVYLADLP